MTVVSSKIISSSSHALLIHSKNTHTLNTPTYTIYPHLGAWSSRFQMQRNPLQITNITNAPKYCNQQTHAHAHHIITKTKSLKHCHTQSNTNTTHSDRTITDTVQRLIFPYALRHKVHIDKFSRIMYFSGLTDLGLKSSPTCTNSLSHLHTQRPSKTQTHIQTNLGTNSIHPFANDNWNANTSATLPHSPSNLQNAFQPLHVQQPTTTKQC